MIIYIDSNFICHPKTDTPPTEYRSFEVPFFNDKCEGVINRYRYVPEGETWTREDGTVFVGEMLTAAARSDIIWSAQSQFEEDEANHLEEIANLLDEIYAEDLEMIG